MSEQITIYQTQSINFTDTSSGGLSPFSRLWSFPGGSITSATGATATVYYNTPGDFNVSLTITDSAGTIKTESKPNLVRVDPAFISANFSGTPTSTVLMSTPINFVDTSTGQPSGPNTWSWNIQGSTFVTQNVNYGGFDDWFAIGGIPGQPPGEIISVTTSLTASRGALSDSESKSFSVAKIGPSETNWINSRGSTGAFVTDSIFFVEMNGAAPLVTSDISYPGSEIIYSIGLTGGTQSITSFHTTTENANFYLTGCVNADPTTGLTNSSGYLIIDEQLYLSGLTQIQDGQYISPGLVSKLYFTSQSLDQAYNGAGLPGYSYSIALLEEISNSLYPQTNSGQGPSFNRDFPANQAYGSNDSPCVISPTGLTAIAAPGAIYIVTLRVYYFGGASQNVVIPMNANSGTGNEIGAGGNFYVMQDTMSGTGVASMINAQIASSVAGGTATVEAYASSLYNTNMGAGIGPTADYAGISLKVKSRNVQKIQFSDNSNNINSLYGTNVAPFAVSVTNPSPTTCTGMMQTLDLTTYTPEFGTRLEYGASIY